MDISIRQLSRLYEGIHTSIFIEYIHIVCDIYDIYNDIYSYNIHEMH